MHVVLLAVLLRGQVWAGVLLLRVVQVRVGVLLWLFEHVAVQSFVFDSWYLCYSDSLRCTASTCVL